MGEKKRIAIATVLSMKPEVLVLGEPTAGLNPRSRGAFMWKKPEYPIACWGDEWQAGVWGQQSPCGFFVRVKHSPEEALQHAAGFFTNLLGELPLTMLASAHDMLLVDDLFPRMVIMDEGHIVADGPTETLLEDAALLEMHGLERPCKH